jgi:hypothetical protein
VGIDRTTPESHPLVVQFLKGVCGLRLVSKPIAPTWDMAMFLETLGVAPFEPLKSVDLKILSYKISLLITLASAKLVEDLHALPIHPSCTQFALGD